jgi:AcrR family transcriptional regulator
MLSRVRRALLVSRAPFGKFAVLCFRWHAGGMSSPLPPAPPALSRREQNRLATTEEIKALARRQIAEQGPGGLSLRAIARQMRMASSALYTYFAGYEDLIGALCVDAYHSVADALTAARDAVPAGDHAGRWQAICNGYRRWSLDNPGDFALIFGTPAPGYQAPESLTGPAAARFAAVPLGVYAAAAQAGAADPGRTQIPGTLAAGRLMEDLAGEGGAGLPPRLAGIALTAWASVLGFLTLEIFGSLTRLIADTDELYRTHVHTVMLGMGFDPNLASAAAARSSSSAVRSNGHGA